MKLIEEHKSFGGIQQVYCHEAETTKCIMNYAIYLPPVAQFKSVPALYWLSGLTCNEQNFITKAGAQKLAATLGVALIVPDTSPRRVDLARTKSTDNLGEGAGFYLDATAMPWAKHYQMYSYINDELTQLINRHFPIDTGRVGIFGHSMGGHGALIMALKNPQQFRSLSVFSPICSLINSPWGMNALTTYLGNDQKNWAAYDACSLISQLGWPNGSILVEQGADDPFLAEQLKPALLQRACEQANVNLTLRLQPGYSHNYYFIASFIDDHLRYHVNVLNNL